MYQAQLINRYQYIQFPFSSKLPKTKHIGYDKTNKPPIFHKGIKVSQIFNRVPVQVPPSIQCPEASAHNDHGPYKALSEHTSLNEARTGYATVTP
jgi:hypothetical protein